MNEREITSIDLVEGGNVIKQGHYLTLGFIPRDVNGDAVDLTGKTIAVALYNNKQIIYETTGTFSGGVLRFTINKIIESGNAQVEFTATSPTDAQYRQKFPTNKNGGLLNINRSSDDLDYYGVPFTTVSQLRSEQQVYEQTVDGKIADVESTVAVGVAAFTDSTEVVTARMGEVSLLALNQKTAEQLQTANEEIGDVTKLGTAPRSLADSLSELTLNAKDQGAVGDGVTDDWGALQGAIVLAETLNKPLFLPMGIYFVSKTLRTRHQVSYHYRPGIKIYGVGKETVIKGADLRVGASYADVTKMSEQSLLAIHGNNNQIENIMFQGGKVGLYFGQDPSVTTESSSVSMNIVENVWFYYNGTALLMQEGQGAHYNKFSKVHIAHAQIGIHLAPKSGSTIANNNRNSFRETRVTRAWIGYLIESGDGNVLNTTFSESIKGSLGLGSQPAQLPSELSGKACSIVCIGNGQYNNFTNFVNEDCEWDIYSTHFSNDYLSAVVTDDALATSKILFPNASRLPRHYLGNSVKVGGMQYQPNADVFFAGPAGTGFNTAIFDIGHNLKTVDLLLLSSNMTAKSSASRSTYQRLGRVVDWATLYRFTLNPATPTTDPIKIKLPDAGDRTLNNAFTNELTAGTTFPFDVDYGTSAFTSKLQGRFATTAEATAYGGDHVIIKAPAVGWHAGATANYISFQVRYLKN